MYNTGLSGTINVSLIFVSCYVMLNNYEFLQERYLPNSGEDRILLEALSSFTINTIRKNDIHVHIVNQFKQHYFILFGYVVIHMTKVSQ